MASQKICGVNMPIVYLIIEFCLVIDIPLMTCILLLAYNTTHFITIGDGICQFGQSLFGQKLLQFDSPSCLLIEGWKSPCLGQPFWLFPWLQNTLCWAITFHLRLIGNNILWIVIETHMSWLKIQLYFPYRIELGVQGVPTSPTCKQDPYMWQNIANRQF